jgi:hypothetical protein
MMIITSATDIFCKPEEVFPWVADPDKAMRWQKNVKGGEVITETEEKIGTTFREEMEEDGKSIVIYGEITNYIQDRLISLHLESSVHKVDVDHSIAWDGEKSTFTTKAAIHWKFPMNVLSLVIGRKIKEGISQQTESELAELKKLCETS